MASSRCEAEVGLSFFRYLFGVGLKRSHGKPVAPFCEVQEKDTPPRSFFQMCYWIVTTVSTVGYGDFSPTTVPSRRETTIDE